MQQRYGRDEMRRTTVHMGDPQADKQSLCVAILETILSCGLAHGTSSCALENNSEEVPYGYFVWRWCRDPPPPPPARGKTGGEAVVAGRGGGRKLGRDSNTSGKLCTVFRAFSVIPGAGGVDVPDQVSGPGALAVGAGVPEPLDQQEESGRAWTLDRWWLANAQQRVMVQGKAWLARHGMVYYGGDKISSGPQVGAMAT